MIVIANKFVALSKPGMQVTVAVVTLIALLSVIGSQFKLAGLNALINFLPLSESIIAMVDTSHLVYPFVSHLTR